jgi:hypothetical protein
MQVDSIKPSLLSYDEWSAKLRLLGVRYRSDGIDRHAFEARKTWSVLAGSATLEDSTGGRPLHLKAGDILLLPATRGMSCMTAAGPRRCRNPWLERTSRSRLHKTDLCAAICPRASSCMQALTPAKRTPARNSQVSLR